MYPYFLWSFIALIVATLGASLSNKGESLSIETIVDIFINPTSIYWFLYVLFVIQIVYSVMTKWGVERLFLLLAILLFFAGEFFNIYEIAFWLGKVCAYILFFAAGVAMSEFILRRSSEIPQNRLYGAIAIGFIAFAGIWMSGIDLHTIFVTPIAQSFALLGVMALCEVLARARALRIVHFLGAMSLVDIFDSHYCEFFSANYLDSAAKYSKHDRICDRIVECVDYSYYYWQDR